MINNLALLVSVVGVFYVVIRAAMLDRKRPWFGAPSFRPGPAAKGKRSLRQPERSGA